MRGGGGDANVGRPSRVARATPFDPKSRTTLDMRSRSALLFVTLAIAACGPPPRPAPAPLPPPPPPAPTAEEMEAEKTARAARLWNEGTLLGRQGRWQQAEQAYRTAISLRPDSVTYHMALTTALLQQGREGDAATALQGAIRLQEASPSPNHALLAVDYERLIQILERVGRLDEARVARDRERFHRMMRDAQRDR